MTRHSIVSLLLAAVVLAGAFLPAAANAEGIGTIPPGSSYILPGVDYVYLSDRYPTVSGNMRVFHNSWKKGGWDDFTDKLRFSDGEPFYMNGRDYRKGIGMYLIKSAFKSSAVGTVSSASVTYTLNGVYDYLSFDLGADRHTKYCEADDGKARVEIYADNACVFQTEWFSGSAFQHFDNVELYGAIKVTITLYISKGSNNTLGVVLGDPILS